MYTVCRLAVGFQTRILGQAKRMKRKIEEKNRNTEKRTANMNLEGGFISKQQEKKNWKTRRVEKLRALTGKVFFWFKKAKYNACSSFAHVWGSDVCQLYREESYQAGWSFRWAHGPFSCSEVKVIQEIVIVRKKKTHRKTGNMVEKSEKSKFCKFFKESFFMLRKSELRSWVQRLVRLRKKITDW